MHHSMLVCPRDRQCLLLLSSVRTWSRAFFESLDLPMSQQPILFTRHMASQEMVSSLKLVLSLLRRGHGHAAGRVARKAFLLTEEFMAHEGPVLTWNLLEMTHHLLTLRQTQLLTLLLRHVAALAAGRMPPTHPVHDMLRALQSLGLATTNDASDVALPSSTGSDSQESLHVLEQAWALNAEAILDRFDPLLINMYCNMTCISCSIKPSPVLFGAAQKWLAKIETPTLRFEEAASSTPGRLPFTGNLMDGEADTTMLAPDTPPSPPDYDALITTSVATLRSHAETIFSQVADFRGDKATLLPMLAWLISTRILESPHVVQETTETDDQTTMYANSLACAIDILVNYGIEQRSTSSDNLRRIRALVALRGYAIGVTNAQTIQDMWLLRDTLFASGQRADAEDVERDLHRQIDMYVSEIPANAA